MAVVALVFCSKSGEQRNDGPTGPVEPEFRSVSSCSELDTILECIEIKECMSLSEPDRYYLLLNDVSSDSTCFTLDADNIILDLNGKTVKYATASSGVGFITASGHLFNGLTLKNGIFEGGSFENSHVFHQDGSNLDNAIVHTIKASAGGLQTQGLIFGTGEGLNVHHVAIDLDSTKEDPCSHYGGHIAGIRLSRRGGEIEVYNNSVAGKGMQGIIMSDCGTWDSSEPALIHHNYVSMWSPVRDGYAISMAGRDNACSDGTRIYNNTIEQISGRGLAVAGWDVGSDYGPGNVEIFENNVYVQEGPDCEYNAHGTAIGFIIRFGAHDIHFHDNYMTGKAGVGIEEGTYEGSDPNIDGSTVQAIKVGSSPPHGINNVIENNYVDISTNDERFPAIGIYASGGAPESKSLFTHYKNNTVKSNSQPIRISYSDGGGYNCLFESTKIIKGEDPKEFFSIGIGYWRLGATGISFLDTIAERGASVYDIVFFPCSTVCDGYPPPEFQNIDISWTVTAKAVNGTDFIEGADIIAKDESEVTMKSGKTDAEGVFAMQLIEKSYAGTNEGIETDHGPRTVSATYGGDTLSKSISVNAKKTLIFDFANGKVEEKIDSTSDPSSDRDQTVGTQISGGCGNVASNLKPFSVMVLMFLALAWLSVLTLLDRSKK